MLRTKRFAVCPHCDETGSGVDHLEPGAHAGPWFCDSCGKGYTVDVARDGSIEISKSDKWLVYTLDVLVLPPQTKPILFVVPGLRFDADPEEVRSNKEYYYGMQSCPTNWLKPTLMWHDGDSDPHGVIEFSGVYRDGPPYLDGADNPAQAEAVAEAIALLEEVLD